MTWAISVPILVSMGLSVLDLGPMYATDRRQTSDRQTSDRQWKEVVSKANKILGIDKAEFYGQNERNNLAPI